MANEAIQRAIRICLEGMPDDALDILGRREVRRLVLLFVHEFTRAHSVIYEDGEILNELDEQVKTRRATSEITPVEETPVVEDTVVVEQPLSCLHPTDRLGMRGGLRKNQRVCMNCGEIVTVSPSRR